MKLVLILAIFLTGNNYQHNQKGVPVIWQEELSGDFSFAKKKSIVCEAWCYEWFGTDAVTARSIGKDSVQCLTAMNAATHCRLNLIITKDSCNPTIELISIVRDGSRVYPYKAGFIKIDEDLWKIRILKAEFDFEFINNENDKKIFWKGKIYTRIK